MRDELNLHRHACFSVTAVIEWDHVVIYALGPVAVQAMHLPLKELEILHGLVEPFDGECVLRQRNPFQKSSIVTPKHRNLILLNCISIVNRLQRSIQKLNRT